MDFRFGDKSSSQQVNRFVLQIEKPSPRAQGLTIAMTAAPAPASATMNKWKVMFSCKGNRRESKHASSYKQKRDPDCCHLTNKNFIHL